MLVDYIRVASATLETPLTGSPYSTGLYILVAGEVHTHRSQRSEKVDVDASWALPENVP